jgi:malate dehydrogenase
VWTSAAPTGMRQERRPPRAVGRALVLSALFFGSAAPVQTKTVAVIGAGASLGPPLSLLLRQSSLISDLRLYDVSPCTGLASDLQHVDTPGTITAFTELSDCLVDCDLVVLVAAIRRLPGMTSEERFEANAEIVLKISEACARVCPEAMICVCTEPICSMVPLVFEVFRRAKVRSANERILGIQAIDSMCANTFLAERVGSGCEPATFRVPVIGGHGPTALPLFSKLEVSEQLSAEDVAALTRRVRTSGEEVVAASRGREGAVYSLAVATARFVDRVLAARAGEEAVVVHAFVHCKRGPAPFMTHPVELGPRGIQKALPSGSLSGAEQREYEKIIPVLVRAAKLGKEFVVSGRRGGGYASASFAAG